MPFMWHTDAVTVLRQKNKLILIAEISFSSCSRHDCESALTIAMHLCSFDSLGTARTTPTKLCCFCSQSRILCAPAFKRHARTVSAVSLASIPKTVVTGREIKFPLQIVSTFDCWQTKNLVSPEDFIVASVIRRAGKTSIELASLEREVYVIWNGWRQIKLKIERNIFNSGIPIVSGGCYPVINHHFAEHLLLSDLHRYTNRRKIERPNFNDWTMFVAITTRAIGIIIIGRWLHGATDFIAICAAHSPEN